MQHELRHIEPPANKDLEIRVLISLACIGEPSELRIQKAMLLLDEECFYDLDTKEFFNIIKSMFELNKEFSVTTLVGLLPSNLTSILVLMMQDNYLNVKYLESDIHQLIDFKIYRKQMKILVNTINDSQDELTPAKALQAIYENLQKISHVSTLTEQKYMRSTEEILDEILTNGEIIGRDFPVNVPFLPNVPDESMITIAGRSGHGKTMFALYLMDKIIEVKPGKQAIYFNLEMRDHILLERLAQMNGFRGDDQLETLKQAASCLISKNLYIMTKASMTIEEIETECRLRAMQQSINVIVVDYIGLVRSKEKHDRFDLEQGSIAKKLASLATDLKCNVLCLTQVNRDGKNRPVGKRCPVVGDSAESTGSVNSSSWWLGIDQPQNESDDPQFKDLFLVKNQKTRCADGLFEIRLSFKNGVFSVYKAPFCSAAKKTDFPDGF